MKDQKIVLFIFAGREENMKVQWPFIERLLDTYPNMGVHLWDLTRKASDATYIRALSEQREDRRVQVMDQFHPGHPIRCMYPGAQVRRRGYPPCRCIKHKPPYEKPYSWYASLPERFEDVVFVKMDDDVLFLETERFDDLISPLVDFPEVVYSANVVNNAVCAKYEPALVEKFDGLYDPRNPAYDQQWWALHTEAEFAKASHDWFLDEYTAEGISTKGNAFYQPTREGEAISINCIAFSFATMTHLAREFKSNPRLGDEGAVDALLPTIVQTCYAAHLSFGPQEAALGEYELAYYREQYADLAKRYLA